MLSRIRGQVVLVTAATAVIAVIVTALVAIPVAIRSVNSQARDQLVEQSKLAVELLATERPAVRERIVTELREQGIEVYLIRAGVADHAGLPKRVIQQVADDAEVDARALVNGRRSFIVGRPLTGRDAGVVLTRTMATGIGGKVLGSIWIALLAGLACGIGAGALLAQFIARPIRRAASAAGKLSAGDRSVRISRQGPAEAGELADAINQLAAALQVSEGRERDFLLSVSHELRTPLSTIRGYAEALADGVVGPDGAAKAGSTMLAEAERLDRLISDLLVLSRLEAADLPIDVVEVDVTELVRGAGEAWAARCATDGPLLRVHLPDSPLIVETDPGRIRQVIDGLCENALRVVPAGVPLVLAARAGADAAVIEVRDGGPGFTDDDLAVAFERGALNRRYKGIRKVGSGLGLALAARLVGRLGGRISAGHAPEGGAMFTVELPYPARTLP
ncbi:HAMP domain-containing sensor histidine kinase [Paractinoplanes ferrugineus]|uniref:Signal transduction histidine-protein kinase/phosphatase MprB n=1 Tax=Paractinoplanes ferrugineus TaxID=113564 RepID=A0A919J360_9ACTN|nr:histidine kinase dimerization/phospho-acceptor domain-containing protein [Actinoplanes ferrugineus]GIE12118.1 two-component sensor histidine kinase [Actinoplanes ferrugineus]